LLLAFKVGFDDLMLGQKEVKSRNEVSLFRDLNSIYSDINLKLRNIKENRNFECM
jgi:hypothetical protein